MARYTGTHLTKKEIREIRWKRKQLRKELKKRGIRSKTDFELTARQLGYVYGEGNRQIGTFTLFWALYGRIVIGSAAAVMILGLLTGYIYAYLNKRKQDYTISLNGDLKRLGFDLSETEDFAEPAVRLQSVLISSIFPMSVRELPEGLDDASGSHNGNRYIAYTFWIRNNGVETVGYDWQLQLNEESQNLSDDVWIMVFDEGSQIVYARAPEGYSNEQLCGYSEELPYKDAAADPEYEYYYKEGKGYGIRTTPYLTDRAVAQGTVETFEPGEKHKYTVVMWIEGDDPDCTNDDLGGHAFYAFRFAVAGDDHGIFDDFIDTPEERVDEQASQQAREEYEETAAHAEETDTEETKK